MCKYKKIPASECKVTEVSSDEEYVYDLEVNDADHMFFANGILVHNSIYVRMDSILKMLFGTCDIDWSNPETFAKIKEFVDGKFQDILNKHVADYICETFHTSERRIEFKREKISSEGNYICKKRYVVHVKDDEGVECDKFTYKGVDIAKNELPTKIKNILKNLVEDMMKNKWIGDEHIRPRLLKIYDDYQKLAMEDIGFIKNLTTPKDSVGFLKLEKGAGVHARAAEMYNQLIEKFKVEYKYEKIQRGDRFHYIYIKPENKYNIDCIAWKDKYPKEFEGIFELDVNKMFEKTITAPLKKFLQLHRATQFDVTNIVVPGKSGIDLFDL